MRRFLLLVALLSALGPLAVPAHADHCKANEDLVWTGPPTRGSDGSGLGEGLTGESVTGGMLPHRCVPRPVPPAATRVPVAPAATATPRPSGVGILDALTDADQRRAVEDRLKRNSVSQRDMDSVMAPFRRLFKNEALNTRITDWVRMSTSKELKDGSNQLIFPSMATMLPVAMALAKSSDAGDAAAGRALDRLTSLLLQQELQ